MNAPGIDFDALSIETAACLQLMRIAVKLPTPHNVGPDRRKIIADRLRLIADRLEPKMPKPTPIMEPEGFNWDNARGFSLLEILISLFVLATGILGLGAMQLTSKGAIHDAGMRVAAVNAANDLVETARILSLSNGRIGVQEMNGTWTDPDALPDPQYANATSPEEQAAAAIRAAYLSLDGVAVQRAGSRVGGVFSPTLCIRFNNATSRFTVAVAWRGMGATEDHHTENCGLGRPAYADGHRRILVFETLLGHGGGS